MNMHLNILYSGKTVGSFTIIIEWKFSEIQYTVVKGSYDYRAAHESRIYKT